MTDVETLKLVNEEIEKLKEDIRFLQEWKDVLLQCYMVHEQNRELLDRADPEKMK